MSAAAAASLRFYLDEDVPLAAAQIGRSLGLDIVSAHEVGPTPRPDEVHLALAAAAQRILVTYNRNDFIEATRDAFAAGKAHAGVLILTHKLPREGARVAHALVRWARGSRATEALQPYEIRFLSP